MGARSELGVERTDAGLVLTSPEVGSFTCALAAGRVCTPGMDAGVIHTLGRATSLVVPAGVTGRVVSDPPELLHHPVGYGSVLYELAPLRADVEEETAELESAETGAQRAFACPHSGRFWHRAAPGDPPFVRAGDVLEEGQPVGLIEVMKTFGRVLYQPGRALPGRARVVRVLAADGADVSAGDPLIEVEDV